LVFSQVKDFVKPSADTVAAVAAWAAANNIETSVVSPNEEWISLTVSIKQANALFAANFMNFLHSESGETFTRTLSFSFPSELVGHVNTAHPMTSFTDPKDVRLAPAEMHWAKREIKTDVQKRQVAASCNSTITPACLEELYGIPTTAATQKSNTLLVTGYVGQFAQTADLKVNLWFFHVFQI
jgi:tripeptidyl-peptidase I